MQELFCFVITPQDYKEMLTALARCPGSRTRAAIRRQALLLWPSAGLMLWGLWLARVLDGRQLVGAAGFAALLLVPVSLSAPWRFVKKRMAAFCRAKAGPGAEGVRQRIFLQDGQYFHQAEGQACSGIPLAALRTARPGAPGGGMAAAEPGGGALRWRGGSPVFAGAGACTHQPGHLPKPAAPRPAGPSAWSPAGRFL